MLELTIHLNTEAAGDLTARVMGAFPGLEVAAEEGRIRFCLPVDEKIDDRLARFEKTIRKLEKVRDLSSLDLSARNLNGPDSAPEIVHVGRFAISRPATRTEVPPDHCSICLEAGDAFGTGGHPSTALALLAMDEYFNPPPGWPERQGIRVLDVGTGSGILSVAAVRLGAGPVTAIDTQQAAVESARLNAKLNDVDTVDVQLCSIEKASGSYDLILANLVPSVLVRMGNKLSALMAEEGTLIVSGFTDSQAPHVMRAMTKCGLAVRKSYAYDGWTAVLLIRD